MPQVTELGRYSLQELIGSGAFADVYRATDRALDRDVALKVLKPRLVADSESFSRFLSEAKIGANLFHPHIATIFDLGEHAGYYFLAMRLVEGPSLAHLIKTEGPLPLERAGLFIQQVGSALAFAHQKGLVHRDIKPQNVIVCQEGAVLTDFGLARALENSGMTTTGSFLGTPNYMPPEIWEGETASPAADQYAFACVIYEMLTAKTLFDGKTPPVVMARHFSELNFSAEDSHLIPEGILQVLERALARRPSDRFDSVDSLLDHLVEFLMPGVSSHQQFPISKIAAVEEGKPPHETALSVDEGVSAQLPFASSGRQNQNHAFYPPRKLRKVASGEKIFAPFRSPSIEEILFNTNGSILGGRFYTPVEEPPAGDSIQLEWISIPRGKFFSFRDEKILLPKYAITKHPITNQHYKDFLDELPQKPVPEGWDADARVFPEGKANHPVINVTYQDALDFCAWAGCRLPSQQQWLKAARGKDKRLFPWKYSPKQIPFGNCREARFCGTTPVDQFPTGSSPFGVMDMLGNVWEWTCSKDETSQVLLGGCWSSSLEELNVFSMIRLAPSFHSNTVGFRCALDYDSEPSREL